MNIYPIDERPNRGLRSAVSVARRVVELHKIALQFQANDSLPPYEDEYDGCTFESDDDVSNHLYDMPLDICHRSGWATHTEGYRPSEGMALFATGGPAVRCIVDFDANGHGLVWQYQDWGTPWIDVREADIFRSSVGEDGHISEAEFTIEEYDEAMGWLVSCFFDYIL